MSVFELPVNEWVVIFYPTTGSVRLCPTLDFATNMLSAGSAKHHVFKSPKDFRQRFDHTRLEECWRKAYDNAKWSFPKTATGELDLYDREPPDVDTETFVNYFWQFLQDVGDRVQKPRMQAATKTKENYELKFDLMYELISDEEAFKEKYNNQARKVFTALYNNGSQFLLEDEIKKIIYTMVAERQLKTKQKPWVIFQYYRPQFIKDGYIVRGRSKV